METAELIDSMFLPAASVACRSRFSRDWKLNVRVYENVNIIHIHEGAEILSPLI
jgi:hypothetical protein